MLIESRFEVCALALVAERPRLNQCALDLRQSVPPLLIGRSLRLLPKRIPIYPTRRLWPTLSE